MAQSQSKKKQNPRNIQKSVFIYCEGDAEEKLWVHLTQWLRNNGVTVKCIIQNNRGGDCRSVIKEATTKHRAKERETGAEFSVIIVMMDTDNRYKEAQSLINSKRLKKKPIWKFVLCNSCFEEVIAELLGKREAVSAAIDKKRAIRDLIGQELDEIEWEYFLGNHKKTLKDLFDVPAFSEVKGFFFPDS